MPLVRIDLSKEVAPEALQAVSDVVYDAMIEVANVPEHDKFQVITRHNREELVYPAEGYMGVTYSPNIVFIQVKCSVETDLIS
jgi:4-oxalocrotonate tautomerase